MSEAATIHRRRLPHVCPPGRWLFLTWHLRGSLPVDLYPPPGLANSGRAFVWMDQHLDRAQTGARYLARPEVAEVVAAVMKDGAAMGYLELGPWVIMSNHNHLLMLPLRPASAVLRSMKARSARLANLALNRTGEPFWQAETYDRVVRDQAEFNRIVDYIELNPVKAGLVENRWEYRWSSAFGPQG